MKTTNKIIDIKKLLPQNFGKHVEKNGKLFMELAISHLKGYEPINIGIVRRYGKIFQSGRIIRVESFNPFWVILNVKSPSGMVDLLYYTANLSDEKQTILNIKQKRHHEQQQEQRKIEVVEEKIEAAQKKKEQEKLEEERLEKEKEYKVRAKWANSQKLQEKMLAKLHNAI